MLKYSLSNMMNKSIFQSGSLMAKCMVKTAASQGYDTYCL